MCLLDSASFLNKYTVHPERKLKQSYYEETVDL